MMKGRVTADDVAKKAGVSQSTVSRVLNNYPFIKEGTREKVLEAINELGFTRDEIARSLVEKKTRTIGLIIGNISNPFFAESAGVIISKAQKEKYDVIIYNTNHDDYQLEKAISTLIGKRVDGILAAAVNRNNARVKQLYENGFPIVLYNSRLDDSEVNSISLDNKKGAMLAVEHLAELGHKKIAYIAGPSKYLTVYERYVAYREALQKYGLSYDSELVFNEELTHDKVVAFTKRILSRPDRPSAIFAMSDEMALAVMDGVAGVGLKIPDDVSIIGFDNINIAANSYIGLTTISQQKEKMALLALDNLIQLIESDQKDMQPVHVIIEPELLIRRTTGVCKGS
ncbi:LacI family DNA-binding transcriptional regulator [Brevibacillus centrosporus]|uniref:LacI family DNA-binding transcriptional regulator n=1 Tax=Brevibacillus centrosporus TaxID=54910 RepID=UPI002E1D9F80|nr:LacI family DNA-binding transcriptional regulator [Brevibacillus centrosporus]